VSWLTQSRSANLRFRSTCAFCVLHAWCRCDSRVSSASTASIRSEWASYAQQPLLDRYLLTLDTVAAANLIPIWFDTDTPDTWATLPTLRQLLATLRQANTALPTAKRIRLVGGNEGIQWAKVQKLEDLSAYPLRTNWMEHLLIEHLAKTPGNRTLVVYGDGHIHHKGPNFIADVEPVVGRSALFVSGRFTISRPRSGLGCRVWAIPPRHFS